MVDEWDIKKRREKKAEKKQKIDEIKFCTSNKKYEQALNLLDCYLCEYPDDNYMKSYRGMVLSKILKNEEAKIDLLDVINNPNAVTRDKLFAKKNYADILVHEKKFDEAIEYYTQVVSESGNLELVSRVNLAKLYIFQGKYDEGLSVLEIKGFNNRFLNLERGFIYNKIGKNNKALESLRRKEENVFDYEIVENLEDDFITQDENYLQGHIYYKEGRFNKALPFLYKGTSIKTRISYFNSYLDIAQIKINKCKYNEAIEICDNLLRKSSSTKLNRKIKLVLSKAYTKKNNFSSALEIYKDLSENDITDKINLSKVLIAKGEFEKSEKILEMLDPEIFSIDEFYDGYYRKVLTKYRLGKYDEALDIIDLFEDAKFTLEIETILVNLHRVKSVIYKKLGYDLEDRNYTYSEDQIINYSKEKAIDHIISHHVKNATKSNFNEEIDIEKLFDDVPNLLNKSIITYSSAFDEYLIKIKNIGYDKDGSTIDFLHIVTVPGSTDVITMYPFESDENELIVDDMLPTKKQVKRLSQIEKFNKKYKKDLF